MAFTIPADVGDRHSERGAGARGRRVRGHRRERLRALRLLPRGGDGRVLLNEINTIPGMTAMSGFPRLWAASGVDGRALVERDRAAGLRAAPRAARPAQDGARSAASPRPPAALLLRRCPCAWGCVVRSTQSLSGGI